MINFKREAINSLDDMSEAERFIYDLALEYEEIGITQGLVKSKYGGTRQAASLKLNRLVSYKVLSRVGTRFFPNPEFRTRVS